MGTTRRQRENPVVEKPVVENPVANNRVMGLNVNGFAISSAKTYPTTALLVADLKKALGNVE